MLSAGLASVPAAPALAEEPQSLRLATWNVGLSRKGPGLLLRDIRRGEDEQVEAVLRVLTRNSPDIVLLMDIDYDHHLVALSALRDRLAGAGLDYPHIFARLPNTGLATGLDMDGNGKLGEARDAQGYGRFAGDGGMAILSRYPILSDRTRDFSALKWADQPWSELPQVDGAPFPSIEAVAEQRLSTTGHWVVPVDVGGRVISLLAWHATPPVFDGPEDRNGLRNRDEARLWLEYLAGHLGEAPQTPVVVIGGANADPADGDARRDALHALLAHPRLTDPQPQGRGDLVATPGHRGDPRLDTADWQEEGGPGNLRVDYILPGRGLSVQNSGVFWPPPEDPMAKLVATASRHRLVWVDVALDQTAPGASAPRPSNLPSALPSTLPATLSSPLSAGTPVR